MAWEVAGNIRGPQGVPGAAGPAGPAGPAGLNFRGAWAAGTQYGVTADGIHDQVAWGGSTYFALPAANGGPPALGTPPTGVAGDPGADDTAVNAGWALLASQGAPGPQGIQGIQGNPGAAGGAGPQGPRGTNWYTGVGAPGAIAGSAVGDKYLDTASGDVYTLA